MADAGTGTSSRLRPYLALLGSRVRAQAGYRASFAVDIAASAGIGVLELLGVLGVFHNVTTLGGLTFGAALLVFGLAELAFSLADLAVGHIDEIPTHLRTGTLDVVLLRPLPVLTQLALGDVQLRRLGRAGVGLTLAGVGLARVDLQATPAHVVLLLITPVAGAAVFAALFVGAGALQFWLLQGGEFANAFTYGSSYAAQLPSMVMPRPLRAFFTFVVPATFTAYLPTLALLDGPMPFGWPWWLGWSAPVVAVLAWAVALLGWRSGLRHYTGAGG